MSRRASAPGVGAVPTDSPAPAPRSGSATRPAAASASTDPYCGVYCLYAAIKIAGRDVAVADLLRPEYIQSPRGTSLQTLEQAARDHGMSARAMENLTVASLRQSRYPMILHVRADAATSAYDHFLLFLGVTGDGAKVFDPAQMAVGTRPTRELAQTWDGKALLLGYGPIDTGHITRGGVLPVAVASIAAMLFAGGLQRFRERSRAAGAAGHGAGRPAARLASRGLAQASVLLLLAVSGGLFWNRVAENGLFAPPNAEVAASIERAHLSDLLPSISKSRLRDAAASSACLVVDARMPADYVAGHIPGAVNIPPRTPEQRRRQILGDVSKGKPVVIYCQSRGCPYSTLVAADLVRDGFGNIRLYREGWVDWK